MGFYTPKATLQKLAACSKEGDFGVELAYVKGAPDLEWRIEMKLARLPRSLQREVYTVEKEVEHVRGLTPAQRLELLALACRASLKILELNPLGDKVLSMRDPLPESTILALRRLKQR